jgi:hypothetical protein
MYRPTRKMRKAAKRNPQPREEEAWMPEPYVPEPSVEPYVSEPHVLEPYVTEPSVEPYVSEPQVVEEPPRVVEEPHVEEPDVSVEIPDVAHRSSGPEDEGTTGLRASDSGALKALQQELTELRAELEGFEIGLPDPSTAEGPSHPIGFTSGSANEAPRE